MPVICEQGDVMSETTGPDDLVRAYNERLGGRDIDGVLELCTDDVELIWPIDVYRGKVQAREALRDLYRAFPDFNREADLVIVDDDHAAVEFRATGTFDGGPFGGYEPTGKGGTVHGGEVLTIEDGKLARIRVYYDQMEFAREVGLLPETGSPGERAMSGMINAVTKVRQRLSR